VADVTLAQICDAVEATLGAATGLTDSQSYDELTEGVQDMPLLQVYPENGETDIAGNADRTSFRGGVRQAQVVLHADLFARQRSHIGEDMATLLPLVDAVIVRLEAQTVKPYFNLDGIKAFHWRWERVTFIYGDQQLPYVGARFTLTLRLF
jgi:hypothetical protein